MHYWGAALLVALHYRGAVCITGGLRLPCITGALRSTDITGVLRLRDPLHYRGAAPRGIHALPEGCALWTRCITEELRLPDFLHYRGLRPPDSLQYWGLRPLDPRFSEL